MSVINYIRDILREGFREIIRDIGEDINEVVSRKLNYIRKQMIGEFVGLSVIFFGVGLLILGGIFFLIEYLGLNRTLSFLIIGIIILFIGILIKLIQ